MSCMHTNCRFLIYQRFFITGSCKDVLKMFSDHFEFLAGLGTVVFIIMSVLAWFRYLPYELTTVFTFLAGSFFTLWNVERLENKRRKRDREVKMTEYVYGPLHQELNALLKDLRTFQSPTGSVNRVAKLERVMENYRYDLVEEKLRHRLEKLQERLEPYSALVHAARRETETHILRGLRKLEIDRRVRFDIWVGGKRINVPIIDPIFRGKTPLDFLTEKVRGFRKFSLTVYVGNKTEGRFSSEHRIHQISKDILKEASENPTIQEQRRERVRLIQECNSLFGEIEKKVVL